MMPARRAMAACLFAFAAVSLPAGAAMYKWVDEHGRTHYGDSVPPKYANRAGERMSKPGGQQAKAEAPKPAAESLSAEEAEKQKVEARKQLDRQRQDTALLSTYANEGEIELARSRELKRSQDMLKMATAGLARSSAPDDRRKLDSIMAQGKQETDTINARFDAQVARYRELKGPVAAASSSVAGNTPTK
jgi:hypothetical protein